MKIGLLTFHTSNNFGALLQVYATLKILKELGHDCEIINLRRRPGNKLVSYIYNDLLNRGFKQFRDTFLQPQTKQYYAGDDLSELNDQFDCFLVGSDQVWRTRFTGDLALNYFLDFASDKVLKVSYASSFGISAWTETPQLTPAVKALLHRFNAVSVREDSGVEICRNEFGVKAEHVLDPTLLLQGDDYDEVISDKMPQIPQRYCATFLLDANGPLDQRLTQMVKSGLACEVISLSIPKLRFMGKALDWKPRRVGEWVYLMKNAEYVITESFHCTVFAILFRKKFICIVNERRGRARLESLLGLLGLSERLVDECDCNKQSISELLSKEIDYADVHKLLAKLKTQSVEYLKSALGE